MVELNIKTSTHPYKVHIGSGLRKKLADFLPKNYSAILIITDDHVAKLYLEDVLSGLKTANEVHSVVVPAGEQTKSIEQYSFLQTKAIELGLNRNSLIIALGGGVIGDLAGFVAATFMRGIDFIQVPTTILAHDSSVGGKVAINHKLGKNMIGNFYPPRAVVYDVATVATLSEAEVRSGYAELVKEALIADESFFGELLMQDLDGVTRAELVYHLEKGIAIKAQIVEEDERENGIRAHLNLGHTLGHAIEAEMGYGAMTHGEAIAIGLVFALQLSEKYEGRTFPHVRLYKWLIKNGYPFEIRELTATQLINRMKSDKKVVSDTIPMILLKTVGTAQIIDFTIGELQIELERFLEELVR